MRGAQWLRRIARSNRTAARCTTVWRCSSTKTLTCGRRAKMRKRKRPGDRSQRSRHRFLRKRGDLRGIFEDAMRPDVLLVQLVEEHRLQNLQSVSHRAPKSDLRRLI